MTQQTIESTTQKFLDIHDITDDVLVLKDGSTSVVITLNAMNFGLLAEPEQDAIMYAYAGLLNSINYPIQIVIRSQTKDVTSYLNLLKEEQENETSDLKRGWIERYRVFVADLIKERNVLDKKFYVVISANSLEMGFLPPSSVIPGTSKVDLSTVERSVILDKAKEILEPRKDHLLGQFARIGLYGRQLTTQELIQLFYLSYNPEAAEGQQITDTLSYTTPLVQASVQGGIMDSSNQNQNTTPGAMPAASGAPAASDTTATPNGSPTPSITTPTPMSNPTPSITTPTQPAMTQPEQPTASVSTPSATPMTTSVAPNSSSTTEPVAKAPLIPNITKPVEPSAATNTSSAPMSTPTPTASKTPSMPGSNNLPESTTDKTVDPIVQNEIDSTLKELGSMGAGAMPTNSGAPAASNTSTPATPNNSPTPSITTPTPVSQAAPASTPSPDTAKDTEVMPPLPEI